MQRKQLICQKTSYFQAVSSGFIAKIKIRGGTQICAFSDARLMYCIHHFPKYANYLFSLSQTTKNQIVLFSNCSRLNAKIINILQELDSLTYYNYFLIWSLKYAHKVVAWGVWKKENKRVNTICCDRKHLLLRTGSRVGFHVSWKSFVFVKQISSD